MTKIDLITGILGSGKTTFLRRYAKYLLAQGQRIAILENDFGAVNVDMLMLQDLKCENCRLEMVSGGGDADCHKRRFKTQLIALGMQHFDRVLIEPSGIFDMDEFFDTLYESPLDQWFSIGSILTIVDATMPEVLSGEMEYLLGSEAACCGKLLLSKLKAGEPAEEASARVLAHLNRALAGIQCRRQFQPSDFLAKQWDDLTPEDFAAIQNAGYRSSSYVKQFHMETLQSEVHYFMHVRIPQEQIVPVVQQVMQDTECGTIFRIKGSLPVGDDGWLKINATREKIETAPVPEGQAVLIVIGEGVQREKIDAVLRPLNTDPEYVSV